MEGEIAMLKTTVTGSLPKPAWLAEPEVLWAPWAINDPARLEEAQHDAVRLALRDQEEAGIDIVSMSRPRTVPLVSRRVRNAAPLARFIRQ